MKHRCPKCGHRFEDNAQAKAAKARWKHTSKADRSSAASAAAKARWKTKKSSPGPANTPVSQPVEHHPRKESK
jgi:predicted  nucleic acid-binding Zn-ribbon protein